MIVHDDKARLYWQLAIVEDLIRGKDGCAANIRMGNCRTLCLIVKPYPLEVSNTDNKEPQPASSKPNQQDSGIDPVPNSDRPRRKAAMEALHQISVYWYKH